MTPEQFQELLKKFSRGACTPAEEQLIIDWYDNIGENDPVPPEEEQSAGVGDRIWSAINPQPEIPKRKRFTGLSRAAIIVLPLLALGLIYLNRQSFTSLITPLQHEIAVVEPKARVYKNADSKPLKISLTDGSTVVLEPSSEIVVNKDFGVSSREVQLRGEGFFQVTPNANKPFLVYASEVVTRVLGTSFHIRAYENDGEVTVAVKTGKVSVYANKNKTSRQVMQSAEVILTPNQQMVYHRIREVISKTLVEKPEIILPNSNLFRMQFDNAEVSEIFDVLEENYGVVIDYDRKLLANCRLTTSMSDEGLYERIEVICKALGASYSIDDDAVITIKSSGC